MNIISLPKVAIKSATGKDYKSIESQVVSLKNKGVEFERFDSLEQDDFGIWVSPNKAKIAWFKDPDRNVISLTEYPNPL